MQTQHNPKLNEEGGLFSHGKAASTWHCNNLPAKIKYKIPIQFGSRSIMQPPKIQNIQEMRQKYSTKFVLSSSQKSKYSRSASKCKVQNSTNHHTIPSTQHCKYPQEVQQLVTKFTASPITQQPTHRQSTWG
jgi:hypothetical protein